MDPACSTAVSGELRGPPLIICCWHSNRSLLPLVALIIALSFGILSWKRKSSQTLPQRQRSIAALNRPSGG